MITDNIGSEQKRAGQRYAQRYQLRVSRSDPFKVERAPWALDRNAYQHLLPPWGEPTKLKLPRDELQITEETTTETQPAPRATRGGVAAVPETLSWAWHTSHGGAGAYAYVSTDPIPWPFRIVGFSADIMGASVVGFAWIQLQLYATDTAYDETFEQISETPLLTPAFANGGGITQFGLFIPLRTQAVGNARLDFTVIASSALATTVRVPGKRLTIGLLDDFAFGTRWTGHVVVERVDGITENWPEPPAPRIPARTKVTVTRNAPATPATPAALIAPTQVSGSPLLLARAPAAPLAAAQRPRQTGSIAPPVKKIPSGDFGSVSTADQALFNARYAESIGDTTRASIYRDMYNRMTRGLELTAQQLTLLTNPASYAPTPRAVIVDGRRLTQYV
jgi:hypothetical protein